MNGTNLSAVTSLDTRLARLSSVERLRAQWNLKENKNLSGKLYRNAGIEIIIIQHQGE